MNRINRFLGRSAASVALGLTLALGLGACTTANVGVSSDFDHAVNFRAYKTWAWYPRQASDTDSSADSAPGSSRTSASARLSKRTWLRKA